MFYVYLLQLHNNTIYTGFTTDLKRRINEHQNGQVQSTKPYLPTRLIHAEAYLLKSDAIRREKYLKSSDGKKQLKQQIRDLLIQEKIISGGVA